MVTEAALLAGTAGTIAFVHTLLGPDHYVPFVAMAKARGWNLTRTVVITLWCGAGHLVGSILLGFLGIWMGSALSKLVEIESVRGDVAAWLLCGFGLAYAAWGLRQAARDKPHVHRHKHGEVVHEHEHDHHGAHSHVHDAGARPSITPWVIFVIFILGPCEPLIPLLMYPAATQSMAGVILVVTVFSLVTVATMLSAVAILHAGLRHLRFDGLQRFGHAFAGTTLFLCGAGMAFLGL